MQTIEALKRKIKNADDLLAVVQTMKALAAVSIRQYEKTIAALAEYNRTIEMGLHIVLRTQTNLAVLTPAVTSDRLGVIVFGTDQGLCGQLNEQLAGYTLNQLNRMPAQPSERAVLVIGERVAGFLQEAGQPVERCLPTPGSISAITALVQDLLLHIDAWRTAHATDQIQLFYSQSSAGNRYQPYNQSLLPLDLTWLQRLQQAAWPSRVLPTFTMPADRLFSMLVRQHLFVTLYRAAAEALATENASRLTAMQSAEKNIEEHLQQVTTRFHHQRQQVITTELLDIVAGYEAVTGS
jgi:F-type H+-transporting ATPase subunit gamma